MQYRKFGKLNWNASILGFGCMRLPERGTYEDIDEPEAIRMVRGAIDRGVNYIDTAWMYHGGNSETLVGKALKDGYREKVKVATKLPMWEVKEKGDLERILNTQLERLDVEHIDLYLLHSLTEQYWESALSFDVLPWAESAVADGRIGRLGFSFHDEFPVFKRIVDAYDGWVFCQIIYNYISEKDQAGTKGLEYAASKGLAVVVMEPLLGGNLVTGPAAIMKLWSNAEIKRTPADWALQWLWNRPEVTVVLSGMSTFQQVEENLRSSDASQIGLLGRDELELVGYVRDTYEKLRPIPCTSCKYCMPCPSGVAIPRNLNLYNTAVMFDQMGRERENYGNMKEEVRASACTQCLECEEKCPQKINISEWMACIDGELAERR
jgi:predicted aldo/keto reductase-like oxidoreductase